MNILELQELKLTFNGRSVIDGLSLAVEPGEIHGVLGVNGTGKTTLAYLIMGVNYTPDAGKIIFEGKDITTYTISQRAQMGITLAWQEPARFEGLTIREYLEISRNLGLDEVEDCLLRVGLNPQQYLYRAVDVSLSGGERKRVELASVLAMKPKIAVLDEPDSGIDIVSLPYIMNGIVEMSQQVQAELSGMRSHQPACILRGYKGWLLSKNMKRCSKLMGKQAGIRMP